MWNPPLLHYRRKVPEVHVASSEIQGLNLCCSLRSLCVTLKYAAHHKHSWSPKFFSSYSFLFSYWNTFSMGFFWLSPAQTKAQSPSGAKFAREGLVAANSSPYVEHYCNAKENLFRNQKWLIRLDSHCVAYRNGSFISHIHNPSAKGFVGVQCTSNVYLNFRVSNELLIL